MTNINEMILRVEDTFRRDDLSSIDRKSLERLVTYLYDGLVELRGDVPDWWERDIYAEESVFCVHN